MREPVRLMLADILYGHAVTYAALGNLEGLCSTTLFIVLEKGQRPFEQIGSNNLHPTTTKYIVN